MTIWATAAAAPFDRPGDFVFCRPDGRPYDPDVVREWVLYPAMDRLKIERTPGAYGFHLFRHSAGSRLHTLTGDIKLVQETLGHARASTTSDIYVHLDPEVADTATDVLARELFGEGTTQSSEAIDQEPKMNLCPNCAQDRRSPLNYDSGRQG